MTRDFMFRRFTLTQQRAAMKVGTDGVLLGAWVSLPTAPQGHTLRVLDIGTGTGLLALMIAQRLEGTDFAVTAIDIDSEAAAEAADNVARSPWGAEVSVRPLSLAAFEAVAPEAVFDLIVCNPPFYRTDPHATTPTTGRAAAREQSALPARDVARYAQAHLAPHGRLALVYPLDYEADLLLDAAACGLAPRRLTAVATTTGKPPKRRLAEWQHAETQIDAPAEFDTLTLHTPACQTLTAPFYLHP